MGFLRRLLGGGGPAEDAGQGEGTGSGTGAGGDATLHSVVAWVRLVDPTFADGREQRRLFGLEDRLMRALYESGEGDLDTNELDRGFFALRFIGQDADRMVAVIGPLLGAAPRGSYLAVRRGPAGTGEDRLELPLGS